MATRPVRTLISAIALWLSSLFCGAGSKAKAMWRPSGETSNTVASGSSRGNSYGVPSNRSTIRPLAISSTCRWATRSIGRLRSQWRYWASEVTYAVSLRSLNSFQRFACALLPFRPGQTHDRKAMRLPSGNHLNASMPGACWLTRRASPPSAAMT